MPEATNDTAPHNQGTVRHTKENPDSAPKLLTNSIIIDIMNPMAKPLEILEKMRANPVSICFTDLCKVCEHFFGQARQSSGSHRVYQTPWIGDPRVNIQNDKGQAKAYQVKQVLKVLERLEVEDGREK